MIDTSRRREAPGGRGPVRDVQGIRYALSILVLVTVAACAYNEPGDSIPLDQLQPREIGTLEQGDRLALLYRPFDAVVIGREVFVLDADPPWVRVFDLDGRFVRAMVEDGTGPGQAIRPHSIDEDANGGFVLNHGNGVTRFEADGRARGSVRREGRLARGAVGACGGQLFVQSQRTRERNAENVIVRLDDEGTVIDTIVTIAPPLRVSLNWHPWLVDSDDESVLFYPEEAERHRLLQISCSDLSVSEIVLNPLGTGGSLDFDSTDTRGLVAELSRPEPPFPAGLVRLNDAIVWATQVIQGSEERTLLRIRNADGQWRALSLEGWYQVLDAGDDGAIVFSSRWGGDNWWGDFPSIFLVDGSAIFDAAAPEAYGSP